MERSSAYSVARTRAAGIATWLAMLAINLDAAFINVALPSLSRELHISPAQSIWVVNAYQIAITASLLSWSALGGLLSYRRIFLFGILLFSTASATCAFADSLEWLVAGRFFQGLGAACMMGIFGAIVRRIYSAGFLARAISYNALISATASALGPAVAGFVLTYSSRTWLFLLAIPLGAAAFLIGYRNLPGTSEETSQFDWRSGVLNAITFGGVLFAGAQLARGDVSLSVWMVASAGLVSGFFLIRRSNRQDAPLFPLDLLKRPLLRLSYLASTLAFAAAMASLVSLPFYLEHELGVSVVEAGSLLASWPVGTAVGALTAGRLVSRMRGGLLSSIGMSMLALSLICISMLQPDSDRILVILLLFGSGLGFGLFQTPNNRSMIVGSPHERGSAAAGLQATARLLGQTSGALLSALILKFGTERPASTFVIAACLAVAAAAFSTRRLSFATRVAE